MHPLGAAERSPCHRAQHKEEEAAAKIDSDDCVGGFTGFVEGSGENMWAEGEKYVGGRAEMNICYAGRLTVA